VTAGVAFPGSRGFIVHHEKTEAEPHQPGSVLLQITYACLRRAKLFR